MIPGYPYLLIHPFTIPQAFPSLSHFYTHFLKNDDVYSLYGMKAMMVKGINVRFKDFSSFCPDVHQEDKWYNMNTWSIFSVIRQPMISNGAVRDDPLLHFIQAIFPPSIVVEYLVTPEKNFENQTTLTPDQMEFRFKELFSSNCQYKLGYVSSLVTSQKKILFENFYSSFVPSTPSTPLLLLSNSIDDDETKPKKKRGRKPKNSTTTDDVNTNNMQIALYTTSRENTTTKKKNSKPGKPNVNLNPDFIGNVIASKIRNILEEYFSNFNIFELQSIIKFNSMHHSSNIGRKFTNSFKSNFYNFNSI